MNYYQVAAVGARSSLKEAPVYHSASTVKPGTVVSIQFGKQQLNGVVLGKSTKPSFKTKQLQPLDHPPVNSQLIQLANWMAEFYGCSINQAMQQILPRGFGANRRSAYTPDAATSQSSMLELSSTQQQVVDAIQNDTRRSHLLHGATGSGKTHIYLALILDSLRNSKSAILLLPEIGLSRHLLTRIRPYLNVPIIELSSDLTTAERHKRWKFIAQSTEPLVVIGPRSAVFAPVNNLGLIIIDEAHDSSFIETSRPHYDTSYVAAQRARLADSKLILGTATPSIEQYWLAKQRMVIHELNNPHHQDIEQTIELVSRRDKSSFSRHQMLSNQLLNAIESSLNQQAQSLVFINRRGFAHNIHCAECGWSLDCEDCLLPMIYHRQAHIARCHTCGKTAAPPTSCPECGATEVRFDNPGTQRIEQSLNKLFPSAVILRADRDQAGSDREIHAADILIGTQLLIKGYDLPRLNTVGVISADSPLIMPDYSAAQTAYQQLKQVIGRNNRRGLGGRTIIQAYDLQHPAIKAATEDNYQLFYDQELAQRKAANYPPYSHLLLVRARYKSEAAATNKLRQLQRQLADSHPGLEVLGPSPALKQHAFGYHHWQLLIKSRQRTQLNQLAQQLEQSSVSTHINPPSLL